MQPDSLNKADSPTCSPSNGLRLISIFTAALVILLGIASFALSFEALSQLAAECGAIKPGSAWVFPLMVDGSIVVFSISAFRAHLTGDRSRSPIALVVLVTAVSIAFNIAHAPAGIVPSLVGAMPPLLLFLSFECLMRQLKHSLGSQINHGTKKSGTSRKPIRRVETQALMSSTTHAVSNRHESARKLLSSGASKRSVAKELSMSPATIRRISASIAENAQQLA